MRGHRRGFQGNSSLSAAEKTFKRFHHKEPTTGAFPFHLSSNASFLLPASVKWPRYVKPVGPALRVLYESDKWNPAGKTVEYYHDHGKGVIFYEPSKAPAQEFPHRFPKEVSLIGKHIGHVAESEVGDILEGIVTGNNILVSSPDGWVSDTRPNKVFLAIINLDGGGVEGLIAGGNLRITSHGIEG